MIRSLVRLVALFAVLASFSGCVKRVGSPTEQLEAAAADAGQPGASSRTLALAGWQAFLMTGDPKAARAFFDQALGVSNAEPWALYGQALLALRVASPTRALEAALDLVDRAPSHPLAAAAARLIFEIAGNASSTDDVITQRLTHTLEREGLGAEAAQLVRSSLGTVYQARNDLSRHAQIVADMGLPTSATLVGPFSPWHVLSASDRTGPEATGSLDTLGVGPFGPLEARTLRFADGRFLLAGEPPSGDVYLLVVDATVPEAGQYTLRTISSMDHAALVDGTTVLERFTWQRPAPNVMARTVKLAAGVHRVMVRMAKEDQLGQLTLALMRADGKPSGVTFQPAKGAAPQWAGVPLDPDEAAPQGAQAVYDAVVDEAGEALARFVSARDALGRNRDGAWKMLNGLPASVNAPVVNVLRAELSLQDRTVLAKVARGRATRDLEAALAKDPGFVHARLLTAQLALDDGRQLDALGILKLARNAAPKDTSPTLLQLQSRIELSLGLEAQAVTTAREAEAALPGTCEALLLRYDVARRRDAAQEADALLTATAHCPGALTRTAEHQRARGNLEATTATWRQLLARDESQVSVANALVKALVAQQKFDDAVAVLKNLRAQWPRNALLAKQLGDVYEQAGRDSDALAIRETALLLDGADLGLRRAVSRNQTGKELLAEYAITTEEALKAYEAAPGDEEANAAFLLDAAAIHAYPDGSQVDRIHVIQKALDQQGVQDIAEVNLPEGAQVLKLRTLKADGHVHEPESIDGKDTVSMPAVQVGDLVEYEYLYAHPTRGPSQPGFTASSFYFQVANQPNNWSTYTVVAPKGSGLKVDAHNMESGPPKVQGDLEVYFHEERRVRPYIPEPNGPVSGDEFLPFVSVGAGQTGNEGVVKAYADAFLDKGLITHEVEQFARTAAEGKQGLDAVKAVYAAVMAKLSGRDQGLSFSASASVSQDRGSRTWLLKAALTSLGFDTRLVAVHAFTADPAPHLFPTENLLPYVCVRVQLPEHQPVWLDALVRYAPFGELPEFAMGEREAYLLPEPGKPLERVKTPPTVNRPGKTVTLTLALAEDGVLTGKGEEVYTGFEAAQLAEGLESLSTDQRDQALQQALSRYFGGADMSGIEVDAKREVGASVRVTYGFTARRFGRLEGDKRMVFSGLTFPALLGRRYLMLSTRRTPLFLGTTESTRTVTTLKLPPGWALAGPVPEVNLRAGADLTKPASTFVRFEKQKDDVVTIEETLNVPQARIAPSEYETFGQFAGEVDLVQGRDLLVEKK